MVDREKTCPLLLRVFPRHGTHHRIEEFADRKKLPDEIAIYTWMDADLKELSDLIKDVQPAARGRNARISFSFIYPDRKGRNVMRQVRRAACMGCRAAGAGRSAGTRRRMRGPGCCLVCMMQACMHASHRGTDPK